MPDFSSLAARDAIEQAMPWPQRDVAGSVYAALSDTAERWGARSAISFQLTSGARDPATTLSWRSFHAQVTQTANLLRKLGVGPQSSVAYLLPNAPETATVFVAGMVAGCVTPINPLLEASQIADILRETNATVLVTLAPLPKVDIAQRAHAALESAPNVQVILEVDLAQYLPVVKRCAVRLLKPRIRARHNARIIDFHSAAADQPSVLSFDDVQEDRFVACFHTGGTTGVPKLVRHRASGVLYNSWLGSSLLLNETSVVLCPLPLFHVFACHVILMSVMGAGAHVVLPTPAGYRGDGVFDNFWKLIERWQATFAIVVPTALAQIVQRPIDARIDSLLSIFSGAAPLPVELFRRFEAQTSVEIIEGYGLTEATCLVAGNPVGGQKKIGSVGIPFPYTDLLILNREADTLSACGPDEIGEICIRGPGVWTAQFAADAATASKDPDLDGFLRTGDLGRIDADGYLWITGRIKELIIRGGHNIDPAAVEDALSDHPAVALVGAVGQPDAHAGEVPCAYVELVPGSSATTAELLSHAKRSIAEPVALPKHIEIVDELPKTPIGKIFKPELRTFAITRVYNAALQQAGLTYCVETVLEDRRRGLTVRLPAIDQRDTDAVSKTLECFIYPWESTPLNQSAPAARTNRTT